MNQQEMYEKTKEIVSKFKNVDELYRKSSIFHATVQALARGADVYDVIGQLILTVEDVNNAISNILIDIHIPVHRHNPRKP